MKTHLLLTLSLLLTIEVIGQKTSDGPYLMMENNGKVVRIARNGSTLSQDTFPYLPPLIQVNWNKDYYQFDVELKPFTVPPTRYSQPDSLLVIGNGQNNTKQLIGLLQRMNIIDHKLRWQWGTNHVAVLGDILQEDTEMISTIWLLYKLEQEAEEVGGRIHVLIGENEDQVLNGNYSSLAPAQLYTAERLNISYKKLWDQKSYLGQWIRSKNCVEIIGNTLIVHGGISYDLARSGLTINQINSIMQQMLGVGEPIRNKTIKYASLVGGDKGPLRYKNNSFIHNGESINDQQIRYTLKTFGVHQIIFANSEEEGKLTQIHKDSCDEDNCTSSILLITSDGKCKPIRFPKTL